MAEGALQLSIEGFANYKSGLNALSGAVQALNIVINDSANAFTRFETSLGQAIKSIDKFSKLKLNSQVGSLTQVFEQVQDIQGEIKKIKFDDSANASFKVLTEGLNNLRLSMEYLHGIDLDTSKQKVDLLGKIIDELDTTIVPKIRQFAKTSDVKEFANTVATMSSALNLMNKNTSDFQINTLLNSVEITPTSLIKAQLLKSLSSTIAQGLASFNLIQSPANLKEVGEFLRQYPQLFATLGSLDLSNYLTTLKKTLLIIPLLASLGFGLKSLGDVNLTSTLISIQNLFKFLNELSNTATFNINFTQALSQIIKVVPLLVTLGISLRPLSNLNANALSGAAILLPNIMTFMQSLRKMQLESGGGFAGAFSMFKQAVLLLPTFFVLAKGLAQFNNVKVVDNNNIGNLGLGIKRIAEAAAILQDVLRLNVFASIGAMGNVKKIFAALAEGVTVISNAKVNLSNLNDISKALGNISSTFQKIKNISANDLASSFVKIKTLISSQGNVITTSVAKAIGEALLSGLQATSKEFKALAKVLGLSFAEGFKEALGIASPSKVFITIGKNVVAGLYQGLQTITQIIGEPVKRLIDAFKNASLEIKSTFANVGTNLRSFGRELSDWGRNLVVGGGVVGFIASQRTQMVAQFDQTLKQIEVYGALQGEALQNVTDSVLDFSARTIFNPQQSAAAFLDLQKAGLSAASAQEVLGNVGNLATAGQLGLEQATLGVVSASQSFNIAMTESERIADGFAQAANLSTADVNELIQGMGNVGPIARQFGLSFEQTNAILALFNNNGIRGAEAGTQLKSMLTNLTRPTEDVKDMFRELGVSLSDSAGNFKDIDVILNELRHSLFDTKTVTMNVTSGMSAANKGLLEQAEKQYGSAAKKIQAFEGGLISLSEKQAAKIYDDRNRASTVLQNITGDIKVVDTIQKEVTRTQAQNFEAMQKLAGTFGQSGLAILLSEDENAIATFIGEMDKLPSAAETSATMMDTFKGAIESLRGSIDTLMIKAIRPLMNKVLKPFIELLVQVVNVIIKFPEPILMAAAGLTLLGAAITTLVGVGAILLSTLIIPLGFAFTALSTSVGAFLAILFNPAGLIISLTIVSGGIVGLLALLTTLSGVFIGGAAALAIFVNEASQNKPLVDSIERLKTAFDGIFSTLTSTASAIATLVAEFMPLFDKTDKAENSFQPFINTLDKITNKINGVVQGLKDIGTFASLLKEVNDVKQFNEDGVGFTGGQRAEEALIAANARIVELNNLNSLSQQTGGGSLFETQGSVNRTQTVGSGDSLWGIAMANDTTVADLLKLNPQIETFVNSTGKLIPNLRAGQDIIVGTAQGLVSSNEEYTKALEDQKKARTAITNINTSERNLQSLYQEEGVAYQNQEERHLTGLQAKIKTFSETALGQKVFGALGIKAADIQSLMTILDTLESKFNNLATHISAFKDTVVGVFTGKNGIGDVLTEGLKSLGSVSDIFETITGIDISDTLQKALRQGSYSVLFKYILNQLREGFRNLLINLTPELSGLASTFATSVLKLVTAIPKLLLESLGIDTTLIDDFIAKFRVTFKYIVSEILKVITGENSISQAITNIAYKLNLDKLLTFVQGFINIVRGFGVIALDFFSKLFNSQDLTDKSNAIKEFANSIETFLKPAIDFLKPIIETVADYVKSFADLTSQEAANKLRADIKGLTADILKLKGVQFIIKIVNFLASAFTSLANTVANLVKWFGSDEFGYIVYLFKRIGIAGLTLISLLGSLRVAWFLLFQNAQASWLIFIRVSQGLQLLSSTFATSVSWVRTWATYLGPLVAKLSAVLTIAIFLAGAMRGLIMALSGIGQALQGFDTKNWDMFYEGFARFGTGLMVAVVGGIRAVIKSIIQIPILLAQLVGWDSLEERLRNVVPLLDMLLVILKSPQTVKVFAERLRAFFDSLKLIPQILGLVIDRLEFFFKTLGRIGEVINAIKNFGLGNLAAQLITGFIQGIATGIMKLPGIIVGLIQTYLINPVKKFLGISSPSTLFIGIGQDVVRGLQQGLMLIGSLASKFIAMLSSFAGTVLDYAQSFAADLGHAMFSFLDNPLGSLGDLAGTIANGITDLLNSVLDLVGLPSLSELGSKLVAGIFDVFGISDVEGSQALDYAAMVKDYVVDKVKTGLSQLVSGDFSGALDSFLDAFKGVFKGVSDIDEKLGISTQIKVWLGSSIDKAKDLIPDIDFGKLKDSLIAGLKTGLTAITTFEDSLGISDFIKGLITLGTTTFVNGVNGLLGMDFSTIKDSLISSVKTIFTAGANTVTDVFELGTYFKNAVQGGIDSVTALLPDIDLSPITNIVKTLSDIELPDLSTIITWFTDLKNFIQTVIIEGLGSIADQAATVGSTISKGILEVGNALGVFGGGEETSSGTSSQVANMGAMLSGLSVEALLPQESRDTLNQLGIDIAGVVGEGIISDTSSLNLSIALTTLLTNASTLVTASGVSPWLTLLGLNIPIPIETMLSTVMLNVIFPLIVAFSTLQSNITMVGSALGGIVKSNILTGFGNIPEWIYINIQAPFVNAIQAFGNAIRNAFNQVLPDEIPVTLRVWAVDHWQDFQSKIQIPDPFQGIPQLAMGGRLGAGQIAEINERRKGVPFETFSTGNKQYLIPSQTGMVQSPLNRNSGLGSTSIQYNQGSIEVNINGTSLSQTELQTAIEQGIRDERMKDPFRNRLQREGRL